METLSQLLIAWVMIYIALLVFPITLKIFGWGVIADPLITWITRVMFPFWLFRWFVRAVRGRRSGP
jgi:hypothetical protein